MEIKPIMEYIKKNGLQVGLSLNPNTSIEKLYNYLPYIHKVLVMTVEPGKGGQELIPETIEKIRNINKFSYENGFDIDIEVDGGINAKTAKLAVDAGANILVSGSYIIKSNDYKTAIKNLRT